MNRHRLFSLAGMLILCLAARPVRADVLKIDLDDTIQPVAAEFVAQAIHEAERTHASAVLIELNTPGGLMVSMHEIIQKILASSVPVIVYVAPAGAHAASAGFFILESADVAAMAPGTHTGAAHPVFIGPTGTSMPQEPIMKEKVENDALAMLRSYVAKRGRNQAVAETAIRESKAVSADEALEQHLIEYVSPNDYDLLRQIDGKTITRFDGSKVTMHTAGVPVRLYGMSLREHTLNFLMDPTLAALLFVFGLMALYIEFTHPGVVAPGVVGFIAVLLALFALQMLPLRYEALVLILGAFVLFVLEAKIPTHGALTAGGIFMMVVGMLLLVDGPIPEMRVKLWAALAISIPFGLIAVFLMSLAIRARRSKVVMGEKGLIGEIGTVTLPLTPSGKVLLRGALWNAVAPVNVALGEQVVVRGIQELVLQVEPVSQSVTLNPARA